MQRHMLREDYPPEGLNDEKCPSKFRDKMITNDLLKDCAGLCGLTEEGVLALAMADVQSVRISAQPQANSRINSVSSNMCFTRRCDRMGN